MREIKFRVWCKQAEEMKKVEKIGFNEGELWYVEDEDHETQPPYFYDDDDWVLMQYTGFKDKDGKEIYEGDIIRIYNDEIDEEDSWIDEVSYHMGGFFSGDEDLLGNVHFRARVIGNIHKNPNMIKELREGSK